MEDREKCKGCKVSVRVPNEQIKEMLKEIESNGYFDLVEKDLYEYRLDQCEKCKYLQYGNTCIQCGCIIQIRARLSNGTCPFPGAPKW